MASLNPFAKIKYLKSDGTPQTLVRTRKTSSATLQSSERSQADLKKYFDLYYEGTVFPTINTIAYNTVMTGYKIESNNPDAKKLIQRTCDNINLEDALLEATQHVLIFGDAFLEKRRIANGKVVRLHPVDPRTMVIIYDEYGDIQGYQQIIDGRVVGKQIKPEDIIHIRFIPIPGSPYGVSLIAVNKTTIERKIKVDEVIYNAVLRHALRKWVATIGTEKDGQIPPDDVMDELTEKLEDITELTEIVVPWMIKIDTIDEGTLQGIREYYDLFQAQLITGLGGLEEATGTAKGITEALARIKSILFERKIKSFQHRWSKVLKAELFDEILLRNKFTDEEDKKLPVTVNIVFNSVTEEDEAMKAKWIGNLLRGFPRGRELPFTIDEVRSFFDLPPIEGGDKLLSTDNVTENPKDKRDDAYEDGYEDAEEDVKEDVEEEVRSEMEEEYGYPQV